MSEGQARAEGGGAATAARDRRPRLGFIGLGWIGRARLDALRGADLAEVVALSDVDEHAIEVAAGSLPEALPCGSMDDLLEADLDGVVIATPNACHAAQALAAIERGVAVFCQKPLATSHDDARRVADAARDADVLLGVDMSYRHLEGVGKLRQLLGGARLEGAGLGRLYALDLTFHNAYGPDKAWFYDRRLSGGGCLLDLGVHLLDLASWLTGCRLEHECATLRHKGIQPCVGQVEDFAWLALRAGDVPVRAACSWNLHAGSDCRIAIEAIGDTGTLAIENIDGSFVNFRTELRTGTSRQVLCEEGGAWGGRALLEWTKRLGEGAGFDEDVEAHVAALRLIDGVYERVV